MTKKQQTTPTEENGLHIVFATNLQFVPICLHQHFRFLLWQLRLPRLLPFPSSLGASLLQEEHQVPSSPSQGQGRQPWEEASKSAWEKAWEVHHENHEENVVVEERKVVASCQEEASSSWGEEEGKKDQEEDPSSCRRPHLLCLVQKLNQNHQQKKMKCEMMTQTRAKPRKRTTRKNKERREGTIMRQWRNKRRQWMEKEIIAKRGERMNDVWERKTSEERTIKYCCAQLPCPPSSFPFLSLPSHQHYLDLPVNHASTCFRSSFTSSLNSLRRKQVQTDLPVRRLFVLLAAEIEAHSTSHHHLMDRNEKERTTKRIREES